MKTRLNNISLVLLLHFFNNAIGICSIAYVNGLFLTSYPTNWLPYFFIAQAIIDLLFSFIISPFLTKHPLKGAIFILFISSILTLCFYYLLKIDIYILPFIVSLFLMTVGLLNNVITWNSTRFAFDLIELKVLSNRIIAIGALGNVTFGVLIYVFLKTLSLSFLLITLSTSLLFCCWLIFQLQPVATKESKPKHGLNPYRYSLFQKIFVAVFVVVVSYTLADYCLKVKLSDSLNAHQIGEFMGIFIGACSVITIFSGYFGTQFILNRKGIIGLFSILPLYWIVTGIAVVLKPNHLYTITLMAAGKFIFYYSIFSLARELTLNVLPQLIKVSGEFQLKSLASPLAGGLSAVFLLIFANHLDIASVAIFIVILNAFLLIYIHYMKKTYVETLKEAVNSKRFLDDIITPEQKMVVRDLAILSLSSEEPEKIEFGSTLLNNLNQADFETLQEKLLGSPSKEVRMAAINYLANLNTPNVTPTLLSILEKENDEEVIWHIAYALSILSPDLALEKMRKWTKHPLPLFRASVVILLLKGNSADQTLARTILTDMIRDENEGMRIAAARVIENSALPDFKEKIAQLIQDSNDKVSIAAIFAVKKDALDLVPVIINRLQSRTLYYSVKKILSQFGPDIIPILLENINLNIGSKREMLIGILAMLPENHAENALIQLGENPDIYIRYTIAKWIMARAKFFKLEQNSREKIIAFIEREIQWIAFINFLEKTHKNQFIYAELISRNQLIIRSLFYWFASLKLTQEVIDLMPVLLNGQRTERAQAFELLGTLLNQPLLTKKLADILLNKECVDHLPDTMDPWLNTILNLSQSSQLEHPMNQMQKIFILRKVSLFQKLSAEHLLAIANESQEIEMLAGQKIFQYGDPPTGLYIIVNGIVTIEKNGSFINELKTPDFFGELALLDNNTRSSDAIAKTDGILLFIEKETFNQLTDDIPQVLRGVVEVVLKYLRTHL